MRSLPLMTASQAGDDDSSTSRSEKQQFLQGVGVALLLVGASLCLGIYLLGTTPSPHVVLITLCHALSVATLPAADVERLKPCPGPQLEPGGGSLPSERGSNPALALNSSQEEVRPLLEEAPTRTPVVESRATCPAEEPPSTYFDNPAEELWHSVSRRIANWRRSTTGRACPTVCATTFGDSWRPQFLMEAPDPVQRAPPKEGGWTDSPLGYGTNRIYVVTFNKFKARQQEVRERFAPYRVIDANMTEWWEAPYLDVDRINGSTDMLQCFWPNRRPGDTISKKEISLWLKHVTIYYHALLLGYTPVTVVEDDVLIRGSSIHVWQETFSELPPELGDHLAR